MVLKDKTYNMSLLKTVNITFYFNYNEKLIILSEISLISFVHFLHHIRSTMISI